MFSGVSFGAGGTQRSYLHSCSIFYRSFGMFNMADWTEIEVLIENRGGRRAGTWGVYQHGKTLRFTLNQQNADDDHAIQPGDIVHFNSTGTFGASGLEGCAENALRYAQEAGRWADFAPDDIGESSARMVSDLVDLGFFLDNMDGTFRFSRGFVEDVAAMSQTREACAVG